MTEAGEDPTSTVTATILRKVAVQFGYHVTTRVLRRSYLHFHCDLSKKGRIVIWVPSKFLRVKRKNRPAFNSPLIFCAERLGFRSTQWLLSELTCRGGARSSTAFMLWSSWRLNTNADTGIYGHYIWNQCARAARHSRGEHLAVSTSTCVSTRQHLNTLLTNIQHCAKQVYVYVYTWIRIYYICKNAYLVA